MYDPARVPLFRLEVARLRRHFPILWLRGSEAISQPYVFDFEIINKGSALDPASLMYKSVFISFKGSDHGFHGRVHAVTRSHYQPGPACYRLKVGPRLACLGQRNNPRLFQHLSATQIIARVLEEHGIRKGSYHFDLKAECRVRDICTQYRETDLQLVERLCSEEGIHYHFVHSREHPELIFSDGLRGFARSEVAPWRRVSQQAGITKFTVEASGEDAPGSRASERAAGESTLPFVSAGQLLPLVDHPVADWNHMWLVTRVEHDAPLLDARSKSHEPYCNRFQATPWEVGFRPPHPGARDKTPTVQRAWVLGPAGQEAKRDRHRRVQVQFDWGRQGYGARYSDCWLSLASGLDLPMRGGMAVAVGFVDGDIDRPLIIAGLNAAAGIQPRQAEPETAQEPDSVRMHLDWQMLLGENRSVRLDDGPTLDLHANSELTVRVGASEIRLDAGGLTLISPQVTFASRAAEPAPDETPGSADEPAVRAGKPPGDGTQTKATHKGERQERQP
jgi:type VI secretion system secreted protein VgrG